MRWTLRAVIVIALLWVAYAAWPFWAAYDLVNALVPLHSDYDSLDVLG